VALPGEYLPPGHIWGGILVLGQNEPAGHGIQSSGDILFVYILYVPVGQSIGKEVGLGQYEPLGQSVQPLPAPPNEYVPMGQLISPLLPGTILPLVPGQYSPGGHGRGAERLGVGQYVPGWHGRGLLVPLGQ